MPDSALAAPPDLDVGVLGPPVVRRDGALAELRGARQRLLLAVLLTAERVLSGEELADALWGDALPADPRGALQVQVFRLRRQLPPGAAVETAPSGYRLRLRADGVDARRFESLVGRALATRTPDEALPLLDAALALWRGPAFQGVPEHARVRVESDRLDELRVEAAEARAGALLALGRTGEAAATAATLIAEHPFRERPVAVAMAALAGEGRQAAALDAYEALRRRLRDELDVEPSPELRAARSEILRRRATPAPTVGLPGNSFHGRESETSAVVAALGRARLVTLTGLGGVGKTRLALHVAAGLAPRYPDGTYVCELAPVADPAGVPAALAATLRAGEVAGRTTLQRVVDLLSAQQALLVLDNCEHVRRAANQLIAAVLAGAPHVRVLATSRQRLGVDGEQCHPVPPLPAADVAADGPAAALFADRAAAVRPGFRLTATNRPPVADLCRRLDGVPLAIELAAARAVSRTPAEILADLTDDQDPARGGISTLGDERRTVARHRSIDAVIGWSHALLDDASREAFDRLAVFAGGFTAEAAAAVTGTGARAPEMLAALAEHSLVTVQDGPILEGAGGIRFRMLEPVRQFALGRLAQRGRSAPRDARERHAEHMLGWAERTGARLEGPDEPRAAAALRADLDNLRAAHLWFMGEGARPDDAVRLGGALYYWCIRGCPAELYSWAAAAAEAGPSAPQPALQRCLALAIRGAWLGGDGGRARAMGARAFEAAEKPEYARWVCPEMASTEMLAGNLDGAVRYATLGIELSARGGDPLMGTYAPLVRALSIGYRDGPAAAAPDLADADTRIGPRSQPSVVAYRDYVAGEVRVTDDPATALPLLRRGRDHAALHGNRFYAAAAGLSALCCAVRVGDPADAPAASAELIDDWHRMGAWSGLWLTLRALSEMLAMLGHDEDAAVLLGAVTAGPAAPAPFGPDAERLAATAKKLAARLGPDRFELYHRQGAVLDGERAVAYAKTALSRCT